MTAAARCPRCGAKLELDPGHGACPVCLLNLALAPASEASGESSSDQGTGVQPAAGSHPQRIGPCRILNVLGQGGMGVVYLAEQDHPIRRKVALKLIKLGMDTREVIARFNTERQALALMSHPNIARVFDAGSSDEGRPYFVMEYVPGIPITDYCDRNRLSTRDRLALFIPVCQAVQHAHQKGVIHRDLKPSNVLVAIEDGRPVPKVIDFGVAKATNQQLTEQTFFTRHGVLLGTPEYMSPEQADPGPLEVDTTTDIYSLGVLLYELLVGVLPFDSETLRRAAHAEVLRIIRDEEPEQPSLRVTRLGADASEVAKRHDTDVPSLRRQLRGDLDWIVLRALEKDRTRRYASASEFAADIERHLADEPVLASPPSAFYRLKKTCRRHRLGVAAALAVLLALSAGLVVSTVLYLQAEEARSQTDRQRSVADEQSYLANLFAADLLFRAGQTTGAKTRLGAAPAALRGWEWRYLYARADSSQAVLGGGGGAVTSVGFSADGSRILWQTEHGVLHAADALTNLPIDSFLYPHTGASGPEAIIGVVPDGSSYVSAAWVLPHHGFVFRKHNGTQGVLRASPLDPSEQQRTLTVRNAVSGAVVTRLVLPSLGESPLLAAGRMVGFNVHKVFRVDGPWRVLFTMSGGEGSLVSAAFSGDARLLATWTWDNVLRVWDARTGQALAALTGNRDGISQAAFSPDGSRIVSASHNGLIHVWRAEAGATPVVFSGHEGAVLAVAWSPDGRYIVSGGSDKTVRVWTADGWPRATMTGHGAAVTAVVFAPGGGTVVSASEDRTLRLWDVNSSHEVAVLNGHEDAVRAVGISGDGRRVVSGSSDGTVRVWRTPQVRPFVVPNSWSGYQVADKVATSADLNRVATVGGGTLQVWSFGSPDAIASMVGPAFSSSDSSSGALAMSADGRRVAWGTGDNAVRVWTVGEPDAMVVGYHGRSVSALAMSPDGTRVASAAVEGTEHHTVQVWDAESKRALHVLTQPARTDALVFSPDGKWLAGGVGTFVVVWEVETGSVLFKVDGHQSQVDLLAFSPNSQRLASASASDVGWSVRLWDAPSGRSVGALSSRDNRSLSVIEFDSTGSRLLTGHADGTVQVWNATSNQPLVRFAVTDWPLGCLRFSPDGARLLAASSGFAFVLETRSPYDPDVERVVSDLFTRYPSSAEVTARLRVDRSLNPAVRQEALALAERRGDDPRRLTAESWRIVKSSGGRPEDYRRALGYARTATRLVPFESDYINTLGVGLFRAAQDEEALRVLERASRLTGERGISNLAFTAMAHQRLGQHAAALAALEQLRTEMTKQANARDQNAVGFLREAEALCAGAGGKSSATETGHR
jgi:eukaryotic-like serine/threonine-protein kinase